MLCDPQACLPFQQELDWITEVSTDRWLSHCVCSMTIVEPDSPRRKRIQRLFGAPIELCVTRHASRINDDYLRALL